MSDTLLITGGSGFIGSTLALDWKRRAPGDRVIALDNLKRRGSELNLPRLRAGGVEFRHGDVRAPGDLEDLAPTVILECSAEPSVMAGRDGQVRYVVDANLNGCVNCLELARRQGAAFVFLSTSRVYPMAALSQLRYRTTGTRFELLDDQPMAGASPRGIAESFPIDGARTLYGTTKLAAELLIAEYVEMFGLRAVINRCGVVSGPRQMGYAEQGVFSHWMLAHVFRRPLSYIGYGGKGFQVRDALHVADLSDLVALQVAARDRLAGKVYNVGGGAANSVSLAEFTVYCARVSGTRLDITSVPETRPGDVPIYVTDNGSVERAFGWSPRRSIRDLADDLFRWMDGHREALGAALGLGPIGQALGTGDSALGVRDSALEP